ncbi:MAG: hypothetical protein K2I10_01890 [Lachnospiraceae bacterium]|nr:hypothetical protein [Lachnospiraceae bacterium]
MVNGGDTIVKYEIYKIFRNKIVYVPIVLVVIVVLYAMLANGEFGYDNCDVMIAYSEIDGELVNGERGYLHNKEIADYYKGIVDEHYLAKMQEAYKASSYASMEDGIRFYNSTFRFFQEIFYIQEESYLTKNDVWGNNTIIYGFTGDWDAYGNVLEKFFQAFSFFIIIFAVQLFTHEKECGMTEILGTAKYGGNLLLRYKSMAAFCVMNILMFLILVFISLVHFGQYGFINADVSIQCSTEKAMAGAVIACNMGQLTAWKIVFGILGCNVLLCVTILISVLSESSVTALAVAVCSTWICSYSIVHNLVRSPVIDVLLAVIPINAFSMESLVNAVTTQAQIGMVSIFVIVFAGLITLILKNIWSRKFFYRGGMR